MSVSGDSWRDQANAVAPTLIWVVSGGSEGKCAPHVRKEVEAGGQAAFLARATVLMMSPMVTGRMQRGAGEHSSLFLHWVLRLSEPVGT